MQKKKKKTTRGWIEEIRLEIISLSLKATRPFKPKKNTIKVRDCLGEVDGRKDRRRAAQGQEGRKKGRGQLRIGFITVRRGRGATRVGGDRGGDTAQPRGVMNLLSIPHLNPLWPSQ